MEQVHPEVVSEETGTGERHLVLGTHNGGNAKVSGREGLLGCRVLRPVTVAERDPYLRRGQCLCDLKVLQNRTIGVTEVSMTLDLVCGRTNQR